MGGELAGRGSKIRRGTSVDMSGGRRIGAGLLLVALLGGCGSRTDERPVPVPEEWTLTPSPAPSGASAD